MHYLKRETVDNIKKRFLELAADGYAYNKIACRLGISMECLKYHISSLRKEGKYTGRRNKK